MNAGLNVNTRFPLASLLASQVTRFLGVALSQHEYVASVPKPWPVVGDTPAGVQPPVTAQMVAVVCAVTVYVEGETEIAVPVAVVTH
jgi:hypothetical protein